MVIPSSLSPPASSSTRRRASRSAWPRSGTLNEHMYEVIEEKRAIADAAQQPVEDAVLARLRRRADEAEAAPDLAALDEAP